METIALRRGDIVIVDFSKPAGPDNHTAAKIRPVLVIQNDVANRKSPVTIISIITANPKIGMLPVGVRLEPGQTGLAEISYVDLGHIYTINKSRIQKVIGYVPKVDMVKVNCAIAMSLGLQEYPL